MSILYDHISPRFSALELEMVKHIPPGGNWSNIPPSVPSERLAQIRLSGGRTTYYGRLEWDKPAYTISTYFNRIGNGCHVHPDQDRLISIREGARLQSFRDNFRFLGARGSKYKQIGNAVPPLLAKAVAKTIRSHTNKHYFVDLFAGAGGLSEGFRLENFEPISAIEIEPAFFQTYRENLGTSTKGTFICGDICSENNRKAIIDAASTVDVGAVVGGPPCQGFSLAGKRSSSDPRNRLFEQFVNIVSAISPEFFVFENVPGIKSMDKGKVIQEIITNFENIGYKVNGPFVLKAEHFGVPQKRRRVFLIGANKSISQPKPVFNDCTVTTVRDALFGLPKLQPNEGVPELDINLQPYSEYQKYLLGDMSAEQFINEKSSLMAKMVN